MGEAGFGRKERQGRVAGHDQALKLVSKQNYLYPIGCQVNFETLSYDAAYRGGAISGSWTEATRNASGTISGRANGDHIEAAARGDSFSANLSLTTRGDKQT